MKKSLLSIALAMGLGASAQLPDVCDSLTAEFHYQVVDSVGTVAFWPVMNMDWSLYSNVGAMVAFYDLSSSSTIQFDTLFHQFTTPGSYPVCLYVSNEQSAFPVCDDLWCDTVEVLFAPLAVTAYSESVLDVYPNPVRDILPVQFQNKPAGELTLVSADGRILFSENSNGSGRMAIDVSPFAPGAYFLRMNTPEGMLSKRIIISR